MPNMHESNPVETILENLNSSLTAWDPDQAPSLDAATCALRELMVHFDPRKDRIAASLCAVSLTLLEAVDTRGSVSAKDAVGATLELSRGLRDALQHHLAAALPVSSGAHREEVVLSLSKEPSGMSLAMGQVDQPIGQVLVTMGALTGEQVDEVLRQQAEQEDDERQLFGELAVELGFASESHIESALRLQARARGQAPEPVRESDPWGNSPL